MYIVWCRSALFKPEQACSVGFSNSCPLCHGYRTTLKRRANTTTPTTTYITLANIVCGWCGYKRNERGLTAGQRWATDVAALATNKSFQTNTNAHWRRRVFLKGLIVHTPRHPLICTYVLTYKHIWQTSDMPSASRIRDDFSKYVLLRFRLAIYR